MNCFRTKDGRVIDLTSKQISSYEVVDGKRAINEYGVDKGFIMVYYYDEDIGEHIESDGKGGRSMDNWYLKDILKQADTIEELCDEFVIKANNEYLHAKYYHIDKTFYIYNNDEEVSLEECLRDNYVIYATIWTDKGLIYVARMNEKGELKSLWR